MYAGVLIVLLLVLVGVPAFLFFYKAPTCFDGRKDGSEQGIDCGGACTKLCASAFLSPSVTWTRFEEVAPHLYNVAAYVVNPNPKVGAANVPYLITLYDAQAVPIAQVTGTMDIPAGRDTLAFKGSVSTALQTPARASMKLTGVPDWAYDTQPPLMVTVADQKYHEASSSSSLIVTLQNRALVPASSVTVFAILEDKDGNAIGFSKTLIVSIAPQGTAIAPFTWPFSHGGNVVSIDVLPVAE